ncbi:hypothetical protein [Brevibacterium sp. FME17]|uniref:hypothetical protein n=1 Tax=Brevibacterium sp. FME17 TaxID=2742606 RepID=UPI001868B50F|nr:hypothetical protein [Brevibacterium sp. FME17]
MILAGCGSDTSSKQDDPTRGEEAANTNADPETTEEQKVAKSHEALAPRDYSGRLLSLADMPDTLSMDEEGEFGETMEGLSSDNDGTEADPTLAACAMNQYGTVIRESPETTAYRTFSESSQSRTVGVVTSLSKPAENPDAVKTSIDNAINECLLIDPRTEAGAPIESADTFEPNGTKGEGICTTAFDGNFNDQDSTLVGTTCFVSWADEILSVTYSAEMSAASSSVDQEAVEGVQKLVETEVLPPAFERAGFAK